MHAPMIRAFCNSDAGFSYWPAAIAVECAVHAPASNMITGAEPEYGSLRGMLPLLALASLDGLLGVGPLFHEQSRGNQRSTWPTY
jgi:hypothetical protein